MDHPFKTQAQLATPRQYRPALPLPTLQPNPLPPIEEAAMVSFIADVAMGLVSMTTIAARYGLSTDEAIALSEHPDIAHRIKSRRAIWESEENVMERNRVCYGLIALDAAGVIDRQLHNPQTPAGVVIDALKVVGKFAGLEGNPRGQTENQNGQTTSPVNIQINFSGGKVESIRASQADPVTPAIEGSAT